MERGRKGKKNSLSFPHLSFSKTLPESLKGWTTLHALETLRDRSAKKIVKAGVNAGLGELVKEIKAQVNGLAISGELKAALRKTVNKRLKKKEGQDTGKAGFGVGKQWQEDRNGPCPLRPRPG